ncbi:MAG: TonB-dependent receptor [Steroidobacteraceae bacterium]
MWVSLLAVPACVAAADSIFKFDIPQADASEALMRLAQQASTPLLVPFDLVKVRQANPLQGEFTLKEGLDKLLENTGLAATIDGMGVIVVSPVPEPTEKLPSEGNMKNFKKRTLLNSVSAFVLSIFGTSTYAQEGQPVSGKEKAAVLQEIVVTAQRYEQTLQTTPVSVVAVGGNELASMGLDSLKSSEAFLPNVSIGSSLGTGTAVANFSIRGIGGAASGFITQDSSVGVYVDDVLLAHPNGAFLDMIDVDRLEVLRGPQGTLFGRNTAGGAVRYVSKKPTADFGGNVKATIGTYNRRDLTGTVNVPLSDTFSTRVSFAKKDRDGYIYRLIDGVSTGDDHVSAVRGQFRWQPTDRLDVNLSADSTRTNDHGVAKTVSAYVPADGDVASLFSATPSAGVLALRALTSQNVLNLVGGSFTPANAANLKNFETHDRYTVYGGTPDRDEYSSNGFGASVQYELADNLTLKSLTGYSHSKQHLLADTDRSPVFIQANEFFINSEYYTQEFQLTGRAFEDRLKWVGGVFYYHDNSSDHSLRISPRDPIVNNFENKDQTTQSYAVFGQGTFKFTNVFSATAGVRWSRDDKDITVKRGGRNGGLPVSNTDDWSSVTPKLGLEQQWTPDFMTYVSAAKGFKAGGFVDVVVDTPGIPNHGIYPFSPENLTTYEGGFRSEFLDHRIRLNGTLFYTDYKDIQVLQTIQSVVNGANQISVVTTNLGVATVKGAELDAVAAVTDKLTLKASFGYTKSKFDNSIAAITFNPVSGISSFNSTVPFLRSPEYSYTVAATYDQPLANDAALVMDVSWGWKDWQLSSSTPGNAIYMPSYGLLNGRLEYRSGKNWSLAVFGTNLLNKYYIVGGIDASGPASKFTYGTGPHNNLFGFDNIDVGRPREAGVELAYKF